MSDPAEAVGPQAGGNEVQQRKARPRDHAHAHGERGEIAHAVDEAEAENEADMVLVQHIEGDVDASLQRGEPLQKAMVEAAPNQEGQLDAGTAAETGGSKSRKTGEHIRKELRRTG